jgi:hypothetical protein
MLSGSVISEIQTAAKIIINKYKDDQLLFIGQSPCYLSYIVEQHCDVKRIIFSGRPFLNNCNPTDSQLKNYFKYLDSLNINVNKRIILIDHSHTGESICSFSKILNMYFGFIKNPNDRFIEFDFLNIISDIQQNGWIKKPDSKYINVIGYIIMPSLVDLANEKYPRTIPSYKYWEWDSPPDYKSIKESENEIRNLLLKTHFVNHNGVYYKYHSQINYMSNKRKVFLYKKK